MYFIFLIFPALVAGHGYMMTPVPRTGDGGGNGLRSPKLSPWANYRTEIQNCGENVGNIRNAERFIRGKAPPNTGTGYSIQTTPQWIIGQPETVSYDIRLGHALSLNHYRIAFRTYTADVTGQTIGTTTSQFSDGILVNHEDTAANRAAEQSPTFINHLTTGVHNQIVTLPANAVPGPAEIQWVWASERDGAGGYYISCADIMIVAAGGTPVTGMPTAVATMPPTPVGATLFPTPMPPVQNWQCIVGQEQPGKAKSVLSTQCTSLTGACATTWVDGGYYHRCASINYCSTLVTGAPGEGQTGFGGQTVAACCYTQNCNGNELVADLIPKSSGAVSISITGLLFFISVSFILN